MLTNEWIKHKAHQVVYSAGTRDPFKICEAHGIPVRYDDLGKQIMAYHTTIKRIPAIVLSTRNSEFENNYACGHELGHHFCHHKGNAEYLARSNRRFVTYGDEFEANEFMADMFLDGVNIDDYDTKEQLMKSCHIPMWAEKYIDWDLVISYYWEDNNENPYWSYIDNRCDLLFLYCP